MPSRSRSAGFVAALALLAGLWLAFPAAGLAEGTCVASAPLQPADVMGLTWSGSVVQIRKTGVDDVGVERWAITMSVDAVYAHLPNHDIPRGTVLAAGSLFELLSDNCGRKGDMGMSVGARYLVSSAFVDPNGTSIQGLIVWRIEGDAVTIPRGLYQTTFVSPELTAVTTLAEAFSVLGISSQPTPAATNQAVGTHPADPSATPGTAQTDTVSPILGPITALAVLALLAAALLLGVSSKQRRQR